MEEAGIPNFEVVVRTGILLPARAPAAVVNRLHAEFAKAVASDEVKNVYAKIGAEPVSITPEALSALLEKDLAKYGPLVKASGATAD
jgi:tripartite-type tricarboxylate transporter receptor subunit TctC